MELRLSIAEVAIFSNNETCPGFRNKVIYSYNNTVVTATRRMSSFFLVSSHTTYDCFNALSHGISTKGLTCKMFVHLLRVASIKSLNNNAGLFCSVDPINLLQSHNQEGDIWKEFGLNVLLVFIDTLVWLECPPGFVRLSKAWPNRIHFFMETSRSNQMYDEGSALPRRREGHKIQFPFKKDTFWYVWLVEGPPLFKRVFAGWTSNQIRMLRFSNSD